MKVQSTLLAVSGLLSAVSALPAVKRDSAINEPAVEAPNGTPITLTPGPPMPTGLDNSNSHMSNCQGSDCNTMTMSDCNGSDCNTMTMSMNTCNGSDCNTSTMNTCNGSDCNTSTMNTCNGSDCNTSTLSTCNGNDCNTSTSMNDCMNGDCMTSTSQEYYTSTSQDYYTSTSQQYYTSTMTTNTWESTSTWSSYSSMATYGSGYMPSSYDSCVQQCINSYGAPPSMVTATASYPPSYDNGNSNGATHTVIVAPTQGVLRYVPFAVNASVGDTVRFVWNAGTHTVTKSSALNLCNASSDNPFKSGMQSAGFVFDQVVNDTNPTFYYCGVPNHCEKGMFGIINPPNAEPGAQNTAQGMMTMMAQNNSDFAAQWSYTVMNTNNSTMASNWGSNMDVTKMTADPVAQTALLQNVMFTRLAIAANTKFITAQGTFNPNPSAGMAVPMDPLQLSASNGTSTTPSGSDNAGSAPSSAGSSPAASPSSNTGDAKKTIASSATALFAAAAVAALVL